MLKFTKPVYLLFLISHFMSCENNESPKNVNQVFFVGGYTSESFNAEGKGISTCSVNIETGEMKMLHIFENVMDPSYLALHPNGKYLYAVNETGGENPGSISAFKIMENGQLEFINQKYSGGDYPCHISVTNDGKYILAANYGGGSVATFQILENGEVSSAYRVIKHSGHGPFEERQEAPHAHFFGPGINDSSAFAIDLGIDKIFHYRIRDKGSLGVKTMTSITPGTGPRHLVFHPTLKVCYVVTEFNNKIEAYTYSTENEPFESFQKISTMEKELPFYAATSSAIKIHPSGKYLYAANRGIPDVEEDNIAMFSIHPQSGHLTFLGNMETKGKVPRDFDIDPTGELLVVANQSTGNLVSFRINKESGILTPTDFQLPIKTATCIKFVQN